MSALEMPCPTDCRSLPSRLLLRAAALALLTSGCTAITSTSLRPAQIDDPPQLSPYAQPLIVRRPLPNPSGAPIPIYGYTPRPRIITRYPAVQPLPEVRAPEILDSPDELRFPGGPELPPAREPAAEPVALTVSVAARAQVGDGATFDIVVRNPSAAAIADVTIEAEFDDALVFPGSPEKKIRRPLGRLAAGESRKLAVVLASETPGRHCARFSLLIDGVETAWKGVCVEYVANDPTR